MFEFLSLRKVKKRKAKSFSGDQNYFSVLSRFKIRRWTSEIEPQEIFLDSLAQKKERTDISDRKLETPLLGKILKSFLIFCFLLFLILFLKTFQLQVIEGGKFSALAQENKFIIHRIQAERGVIYDNNSTQLVFNKPSFDLLCQKNNLPRVDNEKKKILEEVSEILQTEVLDLSKKIKESVPSEFLVAENLDHQTLIILETKINELPGFKIEKNSIREYAEGENSAHLIGYTGKISGDELDILEGYSVRDYIGRDGLEKTYEEFLRKKPGELRFERDALGNIISKEITSLPESGKSLVLWLDSGLQNKIKEELEKELETINAQKAVAVALNPKTGGVMALVSLPDFDNNLFSKGKDVKELEKILNDPRQPLFNRAVSGKYLTGSTIKPLIASAVLEEGIISPEKNINCRGKINIPNPWDPNASSTKKDWEVHGWTNMRKAIAESCNVYFYTVGGGYEEQEGLGPTAIKKYLSLFGWEEKTGIDLPAEASGFIPDKIWKKEIQNEDWWDGDTYNLSIGQGYLQITPIEVANAFSVIANGGILYQPQVVQKIVGGSADSVQIFEEFEPKIIRENFINSENLQIVREGMRQAVTGENSPRASAVLLNSLPVPVAAKTGTAELGNNYYHNWVTVFAPYDDPQIVLTLMIENIKGVQAVVLPVAKAVLEWYFTK